MFQLKASRLIIRCIFPFTMLLAGCAVSKNPMRRQVMQLLDGTIKDDTSYVYALPYETGKTFRVIQGYFSHFSHKERAALDFNMKRGTIITAARDGIVVRVKKMAIKADLIKNTGCTVITL